MQPGLAHQSKEPHRFQRDCFTARVGSGDDQQIEIPAQVDIYGHHLLLVQQGMAALSDMDILLRIEKGLCGVHLHGKLRLGEDKVQESHDLLIIGQLLCMRGCLSAQISQNPADFFLFFQLQLAQPVVQVHHGGGLDEVSGASG